MEIMREDGKASNIAAEFEELKTVFKRKGTDTLGSYAVISLARSGTTAKVSVVVVLPLEILVLFFGGGERS